MFTGPLCDERTLHLLSHLRQVTEEYFNIIVVCKTDVVGIKRLNLLGGTRFCCRLPLLIQESWFQHTLGTQKEEYFSSLTFTASLLDGGKLKVKVKAKRLYV